MKFSCGATVLAEGLKRVAGALPSRTINPVLEGVKVECSDNAVKLTCSDELTTIVTEFAAKVDEAGAGIVPGKLFGEVVRGLGDTEVSVAMNERFAFAVRGAGSRTNLSGQDAALYPELPRIEDEHAVRLPQWTLKQMIKKTAFSVATEDMREVLTGALLRFESGTATMVGLDGFRMAMCKVNTSCDVDDCSAIIPGKALNDLSKLLTDADGAFVEIRIGGGKLAASVDGTEFYATLINGEYINYTAIIPKTAQTKVRVETGALRRAVDRAGLIARQGNNNLVVIRIDDDGMTLEASSPIGDMRESVQAEVYGDSIKIAFNVKYMFDVLRNADCDEIELRMNGAISPCTVTPVGSDDVLYLVLPVRTAQ